MDRKEIIENNVNDSLYKPITFSSFSSLAKTLPNEYTDTTCILEAISDKNLNIQLYVVYILTMVGPRNPINNMASTLFSIKQPI